MVSMQAALGDVTQEISGMLLGCALHSRCSKFADAPNVLAASSEVSGASAALIVAHGAVHLKYG